ncbi:MAG TPA: hypothetical protein VGM50_07010, partial [Gemmatimonadaceae bacterium]
TVLPVAHARLMSTHTPQAWYGAGEFFAPNPDWDATISYYLHDAGTGPTTITIASANGAVIRTLKGTSNKGMNRTVWDLRYPSPVDSAGNIPAAVASGRGGRGGRGAAGAGRGEEGGRGGPPAATPVGFPSNEGRGRGGVPVGPLVLPGHYSARVSVPGMSAPLTESIVVEADPLPAFPSADRARRQTILMSIYDWTKALGNARIAARALIQQRDAIKADLGAPADSLDARVTRLGTSVDRAYTAVNAQRNPIEGWSGMPTVDQRHAVERGTTEGRAALAELNKLVNTDIPAAYRAASKTWARPVKGVAAPK